LAEVARKESSILQQKALSLENVKDIPKEDELNLDSTLAEVARKHHMEYILA
jgi:hypothetical protein